MLRGLRSRSLLAQGSEYVLFLREHYRDDFLRRGWQNAADEFWALTAAITDYTEIHPIYLQVYYKYVGGGDTEPPPEPPPSDGWSIPGWAIIAGLLVLGFVLTRSEGQSV